jgi:hypothetical protein
VVNAPNLKLFVDNSIRICRYTHLTSSACMITHSDIPVDKIQPFFKGRQFVMLGGGWPGTLHNTFCPSTFYYDLNHQNHHSQQLRKVVSYIIGHLHGFCEDGCVCWSLQKRMVDNRRRHWCRIGQCHRASTACLAKEDINAEYRFA